MPVLDPEALILNRVEAIREYHGKVGIKRAELDVSGGVDSAVMLGLLARALGPDNITAVYQGIDSSQESLERAREVAEVFDVRLIEIDLSDIFANLVSEMRGAITASGWDLGRVSRRMKGDPLILGSLRSCLRAPIGRGFNRMLGGGIRHGTGNECEDRWTRFYQKGGDGEVDTNPIAMLSKGEVYQLAFHLGVPRSILTARPSPDLWGDGEGHNDEDEFAAYFGFNPAKLAQEYATTSMERWYAGQLTFYSYVNADDGRYVRVGIIERVSRLADIHQGLFDGYPDIGIPGVDLTASPPWTDMPSPFEGFHRDFVVKVVEAARRIERMTWHKYNPNIPMLGDRLELVGSGILTDTLPGLKGRPDDDQRAAAAQPETTP